MQKENEIAAQKDKKKTSWGPVSRKKFRGPGKVSPALPPPLGGPACSVQNVQAAHAHSVTADSNRIGVLAMKSLSDDPESLCLVKERRELESHFNTVFTTEILTDADSTDPTHMKKTIGKIDKDQRL